MLGQGAWAGFAAGKWDVGRTRGACLGSRFGLGRRFAGWAAGLKARRGRGKAELGCWVGLVSEFLFSGFPFSFSFPISIPFQTPLFEFKLKFEFKLYALNQIKVCTSMNARTF